MIGKFLLASTITMVCPITAPVVALGTARPIVGMGRKIIKERARKKHNEVPETEPLFEIISLKSEGLEPTVVAISGFTNEGKDGQQWLDFLQRHYPANKWVYVRWGASSFGKIMKGLLLDTLKGEPLPVASIKSAAKEWISALNNSQEAGYSLAKYLAGENGKFALIGHSLGGRVTHFALKALAKEPIRGATTKVKEVKLLAGAVSASASEWQDLMDCLECSVQNYYSATDLILLGLYKDKVVLSDRPVGLTPIKLVQHSSVNNVNAREKVGINHSAYYEHNF